MTRFQQFGTWSSPISPALRAREVTFNDVKWHEDADGRSLLWVERRGGQSVIVMQSGVDAPYDLTDDLSVRGSVGYGGGEFDVHGGYAYFFASGRLYKQALHGGKPRALTPAFGGGAAPAVSPDGQWVVYVHTYENDDVLAMVDTAGEQWPRKLVSGYDFVMQPAWHPSVRELAYICWNHPNMPWDGTTLRRLKFNDAMQVSDDEILTGGDDVAITQPEYSPDGRYLAYLSDESGFGHLYTLDLESGQTRQITHDDVEHSTPAWVQGIRQYGWLPDSSGLIYLRNEQGIISLWHADLQTGEHRQIAQEADYTHFRQPSVASDGTIAVIAASSRQPAQIVTLSPSDTPRVYRRAINVQIQQAYLAAAEPVSWTGHDGATVYGIYYAPTNPQFQSDGAPPLIVHIHGGPTSQTTAGFESEFQFYASRGFAVLSVNHRGSTGYGREYMLQLRHNWGYYDVEDAASGAAHLAEQGLADPDKLVIMGGSAGGYTVLQSLVDKPGFYKAGICKYGVSNQFDLATDTHKFESRYNDRLLGPLPEAAELYRARSPIFHASSIVDPLIVFQGEDDVVVPRNQSDKIVDSLRERGIPHAYHVFAGEGHGFRRPETLITYGREVLSFLKQYVIFD